MRLLALDGNSILNRAYYGIRLLSTKEGIFTNGIYGFLTMFNKIKNDVNPDMIVVTFDMREPTFRHKEYKEYKANRKGMPEELAVQMPILQELLEAMGICILKQAGWEADDILGTLAQMCKDNNYECVIATGDRDSFQLIGDNVSVRLLATKQGRPEAVMYTEKEIFEKYGVTPNQLIDIKAIQGDASDNIPGVKGIGEKGAAELIKRFGSLNYIYENIDTIDIKDGIRKKLIESKDNAFLSYNLGTIRTDVPIDLSIENLSANPMDAQKVSALMGKLELYSLLEKMGLEKVELPIEESQENTAEFKFAEETDSFSILMALQGSENLYVINLSDEDKLRVIFILENVVYDVDDTVIIKSLLEDESTKKIMHDTKKFHNDFFKYDIDISAIVFDTMLAAYLINPNSNDFSFDRLCTEYSISSPKLESSDDEVLINSLKIIDLHKKLESIVISKNEKDLLLDIEIPLAKVLSSMEQIGVKVDGRGIEIFGKQLEVQIEILKKKIYEQSNIEFNINSPKQLGKILFEDMGITPFKKTKTGYSTSAEILEELKYEYPIVDDILHYRQLAKLKSTYCDGLLKVISEDMRIHSTFNQTETRTGRISSTEPNLQNIPVRTELGREMRKFFIADEGKVLCDADYSQIELRVLAHVSNDNIMMNAFKVDMDIHRITAAQVFGVPPEIVTSEMRTRAKAVNFGIVYGMGAFSLSKDIGVSNGEASQYIKSYFDNYSGVKNYMDKTVEEAKNNGYAETIFARRRPLPELASSNGNMRHFGERVAKNMPIQGTAADIIKIAMIRVFERLKEEKMQSKLILQIHDELIIESPEEEKEKAAIILKEEMENAVKLSVPLVADVNIGENWYDAKG